MTKKAKTPKLTDEEREQVEEMVEAMRVFEEEHHRKPTREEFGTYWKAYCEAQLRTMIRCIEKQGTPVVYENGKYKILGPDANLKVN